MKLIAFLAAGVPVILCDAGVTQQGTNEAVVTPPDRSLSTYEGGEFAEGWEDSDDSGRGGGGRGNPLIDEPKCDLIYSESNRAECESWCSEFIDACVNPNFFYDKRRNGYKECVRDCVAYPRTNTAVTRPPSTFVHLGSNTWACRDLHLWEAQNDPLGGPQSASFHCSHSILAGGSICADVKIDGKDPFEHLRDGACTYHMIGYCFLSSEQTVADCSNAQITDEMLPDVLAMMPDTVEYIFMMENPGITELPQDVFKDNLANPGGIKALYLDDCNIREVHEEVFHPLTNLEVLNLNFNRIEVLQDELLKLPELRQFSIFGDPTNDSGVFGPNGGRKPGMLTSGGFSEKLFRHTPKLERLIMYGHPGITELHDGMFEGLSDLTVMFILFTGLTNEGIPDGVFEPLESLIYFDMQGNQLTSVPKEWFSTNNGKKAHGWSKNIERFVFFFNQIESIDEEVFKWHPKLKQLYLHTNPIRKIPLEWTEHTPDLDALTLM